MRYWTFISEELPLSAGNFFHVCPTERKTHWLPDFPWEVTAHGSWRLVPVIPLAQGLPCPAPGHCRGLQQTRPLADDRKPLFEGIFGSLANLREALMRFCSLLKRLRKKRAGKSFRRCMPGVERRIFCMKESESMGTRKEAGVSADQRSLRRGSSMEILG